MIIVKLSKNTYSMTTNDNEEVVIDWLKSNFPRKLEKFIEEYLTQRNRARLASDDITILGKMTKEEKDIIRAR